MKRIILVTIAFGFTIITKAQSVAINTDGSTASNSAMLDVKSTTKGLLIPRMSKAQRNAIAAPATGLMIFQNAPDSTGIYYYNGTRWQWMEESGKAWGLNGNAGTSPFTNLVGTTDATDLAIGANGIPRMFVTNEAEVGIGFNDPLYGLDVTTGNAAINNCSFNGIRVKTVAAGFSNICERGLLMGYPDVNTASNEALIWNYGQANTGIKTLSFGVGSVLTMMRLTSDGLAGIGSGAMQPKYALDVNVGIGGVSPCGRNGLRLNNLLAANNPCEQGIFVGYDDLANRNKTSFWNFSADNVSTDRFIRFGFGTDFSEAPGIGESMRILPPGKGVGINQLNPMAMLHISNYTGFGVLPGVMVTSPFLPTGSMGFYTGLRQSATPNDGYVWNYQNAPVIFGTNDQERMRVAENGNVGINTVNPLAILHVADSSVLFSAAGDIPVTPANVPISNAGRRMMWYPGKAAFRVGYVDGVNWNKDSIGKYSLASGYDTRAKGDFSTALGLSTIARGFNSTSIGQNTVATGNAAIAMGIGSIASQVNATAMGNNTIASGQVSTSMGSGAVASGDYSTAMGVATTASGNYSTAVGYLTTASGLYTTSFGVASEAIADGSASMGYVTKARSANSLVVGIYNDTTTTNRLFEVGNGTANNARANAMTVLVNGNVGVGLVNPLEKLHVVGNIRSTTLAGVGTRLASVDANGTFTNIAAGINGQVLSMVAGAPSWINNTAWSTLGNSFTNAATNFIGTTDANDFVLRTANTERMRIMAGGNVGIGTNNPVKQTEIVGAASATPVTLVIANRGGFGPAAMEFVSDYGFGSQWRPGYIRSNDVGSFTGSLEFYTNGTGAGNLYGNVKGLEVRNGVTYTATGTVSSFSDERIKNNVQAFTGGLDIIQQINPVSFYYNSQSPFQTDKMQVGVLAQELEKVAPYMVDKNVTKDFDDLRSVNNQAYIFLLINAVKEQQKQLEEQRKMIEELKRK